MPFDQAVNVAELMKAVEKEGTEKPLVYSGSKMYFNVGPGLKPSEAGHQWMKSMDNDTYYCSYCNIKISSALVADVSGKSKPWILGKGPTSILAWLDLVAAYHDSETAKNGCPGEKPMHFEVQKPYGIDSSNNYGSIDLKFAPASPPAEVHQGGKWKFVEYAQKVYAQKVVDQHLAWHEDIVQEAVDGAVWDPDSDAE
jgi:hypothetical protein